MKHPLSVTAVALLVLSALCLPVGVAHAEPNLGRMDLGSYATGPDIVLSDLRGRVVVVEYWGITCGPCLRAIPHTSELAEKYGHEKLVIIANQSWSATDKQVKEVWEKHAKSKHVAVRNGAKLPGFSPRSVPRAVIFDHNAKKIWEGHPGSMDKPLADAIANMPAKAESSSEDQDKPEDAKPDPIITTIDAEHFDREVEQINAQDRPITSALRKLRRAAERSTDEAQVGEAKAVLKVVADWANRKQAEAERARGNDPATAYAIAEHAAAWLVRDDLAKPFEKLKDEMEADAKLMARVQSTLLLRTVMANAESIGLTDDSAAVTDRRNSRTVRLITRDLNRLVSDWPDTNAGKEAAQLIEAWGLGE